jgi:fructose-specific phosphotransferase system IIC component
MLTKEEEAFLKYWSANREREAKPLRMLTAGLPWGLLLGLGIVLALSWGGWYERATMVADTELNPWVLLIAVIIIAMFTGYFYKKHRWDQNEQLYREINIRNSPKH